MEETVFALLYRRLAERRSPLEEYIVQGGPTDYVAYARATAQREAYVIIEEDIKDLEKRFIDQ